MAADFCRLCLRPIDKAKSTDLVTETTKSAMLKEFLPEMNLDISENTQVCSSCIEELETSYNFKHGVVVNETNIQTKLEENDLKKIDLKLMLDDVAKKEVKTDDYVCRTCFSICRTPSISLFDSPTNMMPYSFVKKMCQVVFELEFIAADKPVLCDDCWETLQTVYNFRKCCLRTDKKLRIFVANKNITKVNNDEFKEFAEENPPKDDAEDSSDDELDEYIKEEPVDADEMKFDPDEASCSSSSVKVKKETAVKSESELNSEDEDMEDEPELLDPKTIKSEASELDGEECKMEIGDVKVDAEGEGSAGPSGSVINGLTKHLQEVPRTWFCPHCSNTYRQKEKLWAHIMTLHTVPELEQKVYYCFFCSERIAKITDMDKHMKDHECFRFECPSCAYTAPKQSRLFQHRQAIHKQLISVEEILKCPKCPYETFFKSYLRRHMRKHKDGNVQFPCPGCPKIFSSQFRLNTHMNQEHIKEQEGLYLCPKCQFKTQNKPSLTEHVTQYHELQVACIYCPIRYKTKGELHRHLLRDHNISAKDTVYQCPQCSFKAVFQSELSTHMLVHGEPSMQCPHCPTKCKKKSGLKAHIKLKHSRDNLPFLYCNDCSYKSTNKSNLISHMAVHNKKRVQCQFCPKMYQSNHSLKVHVNFYHTSPEDLKQYQCESCSYKTHVKCRMTRHIKVHIKNGTGIINNELDNLVI